MRRTDLAAEALDLLREQGKKAGELTGVKSRTREEGGFSLTEVEITDAAGARALGKPVGRYVTADISPVFSGGAGTLADAVSLLGRELRRLLPEKTETLLCAGLGNAGLTADALGPLAVGHILPTRHLQESGGPFAALPSLSVLAAEVVGKTGIEAAEQLTALTKTLCFDAVVVIDALAGRSVHRLCRTVQLADTGLVPGSGIGNHRRAIDRSALGVPVIAIGVPTVVDAATLALDLLEEAGAAHMEPKALRRGLFVTPKEIDERTALLARLIGYAVNAAALGLSAAESAALLG